MTDEKNHVAQKLSNVGCLLGLCDATMVETTSGSPTIPPAICRARNVAVRPPEGRDMDGGVRRDVGGCGLRRRTR